MVLHSGRGRTGDINTLECGACREGDRREAEVMACGDDTIFLVVSLSCRIDPDSDTTA